MPETLWKECQAFIRPAHLSAEDVCVLLVFLCIRGLSKSKPLAEGIGVSDYSNPTLVTHALINQEYVITMNHFSADMEKLLEGIIIFSDTFNFSQFLQEESVPHHLTALDNAVKVESFKAYKCYLIAMCAAMCGLGAARTMQGSLFLDASNGRNVMLGVQRL